MAEFPHLKLPFKVEGSARPGRAVKNAQAETVQNKENREKHGQKLNHSANELVGWWERIQEQRPPDTLPNPNDIPVFLKVDTEVFDIDSLRHWGIEVVSEEDDGFVIGASTDKLQQFKKNVESFLNSAGIRKDKAAQIWDMVSDEQWRLEKLVEPELQSAWQQLEPEATYTIEIGVSCYVPSLTTYPNRAQFESEEEFQKKVAEFDASEDERSLVRDDRQRARESEVERYVEIYGGEIHQIWSNDEDAVYLKISISGKGLKDIVQTYQYLFEARFETSLQIVAHPLADGDESGIEINPPLDGAPSMCVIDSGIQEEHPLVTLAIDAASSKSYVPDDSSTADYVKYGGHGTKVAGAVLYGNSIPRHGKVTLPCKIQNARILDRDNSLPTGLFQPALMEEIVEDYNGTRLFNLSVGTQNSHAGTHMPAWAAAIDKLMHEEDVLFLVSSGNIPGDDDPWNVGIKSHHIAGRPYPDYLSVSGSRINNPGVSLFALTVGSISRNDYEDADYKSLAGTDYVSPFSRVGPGLWGTIKPDVVEFGGDFAKGKFSNNLVVRGDCAPELVNSTRYGASPVGKDSCGTSFSCPKVSHIAARLQAEHPDESAQMYRALIVQSARHPEHCFNAPTPVDFQHYGYGVPDLNRAVGNTQSRITFIQTGNVSPRKADIYNVNVPEELRGGDVLERVLVEVTLTFTAKTRLTRKGAHSYLGTWLEWRSSRYNEGFQSFRNRTLDYLDANEEGAGEVDDGEAIRWVIRENPAWGLAGINRNNSTVQKSWAIIEPHQFAEQFNIAVIGHAGWDKDLDIGTNYALCVSFEALDIELNIYELMAQAQIEIEQEQEIEI
ncbi:MAG: S8 family peptidase [Pyrinomonadaceae bacterium]|nr:S8 family peptidase [Pyrinomonadaceae bacterium]